MKNKIIFIALFIILLGTASMTADAAQKAKVVGGSAEVHEKPAIDSDVLATLDEGKAIAVSNKQTKGFYKTRTPDGQIGWIEAKSVSVVAGDDESEDEKESEEEERPKLGQKKQEKRIIFRGKVLAGLQLFTPTEVNNLVSNSQSPGLLSNGPYFGVELGLTPGKVLAVLLRVEQITKSVSASDTDTDDTYLFQASSMPVMLGLGLDMGRSKKAVFGLAVLGGLGLSTKFSSTATSQDSPNETVLTASPVTFTFKADFNFYPSPNFMIFVEGGYRLLSTSALTPSTVGNGNDLFQVNGEYSAAAVNMGGLFFGGGIGFAF